MKKVLKIEKSKAEMKHLERLDYIESKFRKGLTHKEIIDLYDKLQSREDRITIPMKLLSYDEEGELNARLHIIDGGKLPITHTIDFFEYVNMENTAVYPLTYNKVLITYTDMEEDIHRLDIFNLDTKKVIYTMEESKEKMGEVVFKHKLYIFYTDHTVIYDISTNTTSEIKIENMPDVTDMQIYIINNKIIANYIDTLIYEIDVENGKAILIYKSDDIENNFGFYNGETLIITEGSFMKITNKATGNIISMKELLYPIIADNIRKWFDNVLVIVNLEGETKHIIRIDISKDSDKIEEATIDRYGEIEIASPNILYDIVNDVVVVFDISDIDNITSTETNFDVSSEDASVEILSPTQILMGADNLFEYYIVKDEKELIKVDEINMGNLFVILPPDPKDISKIVGNVKTNFLSSNIKKLIANFV